MNNQSGRPIDQRTDFSVACPSDVTFNDSSGLPASYKLDGNGCKTNGND